MLLLCSDEVCNARVDVQVDKQGVIHAWNNQGGRSSQLNNAMKVLFSTTAALNVLLHPHCFSISFFVGPVLIYLQSMKQACTVAVLNSYPRKYWWSLLHHYAKKAFKMASTGDGDVLLIPPYAYGSGLDPTPRNSGRSLGILGCLLEGY